MSDFIDDICDGAKKVGVAIGDFVEEHPILTTALVTLAAGATAAAVSRDDSDDSPLTDNSNQGSGVGLVGIVGEIVPDENHSSEDIIGDYADIFRG